MSLWDDAPLAKQGGDIMDGLIPIHGRMHSILICLNIEHHYHQQK